MSATMRPVVKRFCIDLGWLYYDGCSCFLSLHFLERLWAWERICLSVPDYIYFLRSFFLWRVARCAECYILNLVWAYIYIYHVCVFVYLWWILLSWPTFFSWKTSYMYFCSVLFFYILLVKVPTFNYLSVFFIFFPFLCLSLCKLWMV